ncbi:hypothetical protein CsatA_010293 [Cannabis sativa]
MAIAKAITQVLIREVWRENLLEEFQLIGKLIHDCYHYISFGAHDSIDLLKKQGIDFERNLSHGINSAHFANLMYHYRLVFNSDITWITFHSAYDFGYLVKILTGCFLPHFLSDFLYLVRYFFGQNVYDMKYMMGFFPGLYGGLESLAGTLQIVREVGLSHQAGSDSLLTWRTFQKMRLTCFDSDEKELRKYGGALYGLKI